MSHKSQSKGWVIPWTLCQWWPRFHKKEAEEYIGNSKAILFVLLIHWYVRGQCMDSKVKSVQVLYFVHNNYPVCNAYGAYIRWISKILVKCIFQMCTNKVWRDTVMQNHFNWIVSIQMANICCMGQNLGVKNLWWR